MLCRGIYLQYVFFFFFFCKKIIVFGFLRTIQCAHIMPGSNYWTLQLVLKCVLLKYVTAASIASVLGDTIASVESALITLTLQQKVVRVNSALPYYKLQTKNLL